MIRVGIVGLGFMGRMHYRCWKAIPGATITAICEANPKVLAAAGEPSKGNVGGAADHIDLKDVSVHSDLGELLATRSVDALSITPPTCLHPDTTVKALEAGVHVLTVNPARRTGDAAGLPGSPAVRAGLNEPVLGSLIGTSRPTPPDCVVCSERVCE
jgi:predicted homoserine dehydrogenase-like protein